ncbi:hypothetical protein SPRG_02445 [Saprolegnia parasitica CBS 223.65]|uniref:EF-hand domain-containing protein n=1 Tax=Saprolegnia parasitica (strain CBS 223.65) TaxID=695850 RepID=A0A067D143_SAPPC|nr:hypothetical protein SPRG_02445 [Saprolegnia parasitica CBS 223.65]KDO32747.1 hypothetical protein SPRG_02445 [Saprolegnia parasitica CBS 223.65]|eukprot:XP_012196411.1 hypothetical protein SPRG_02445 [Saprolegnia parasitica CBS 223.65]
MALHPAAMASDDDAQLWWRHAKPRGHRPPRTTLALARELALDEERDWMKKHKKARKFEFTAAEKRILRQWFDVLDTDQSGSVSTEELEDTLLTLGLASTADETEAIVNVIDTDGSGSVDFHEFVRALMPASEKKNAGLHNAAMREKSFLGLKKSMEAQAKGLLDAKTHVSIERRKFLVNTITSRKCEDIDVAVHHALCATKALGKPHRPSLNTLRLDGLHNVFRRSAAVTRAKSEAMRARQLPSIHADETHAEVTRRLHAVANARAVSEQRLHTSLPAIGPARATSEQTML